MAIKAAIDVGSNSLKLLVAHLDGQGHYSVIAEESEVTGLAAGLTPGGPLNPEGVERSLRCLERFVDRARLLGATHFEAAGTSALRDAGDAQDFLARVRADLQLNIRVLSGEDEARLSRVVALRELPAGSPDVVFFDVGGGSTELTLLHGPEVRSEVSLQLGARRATDKAQLAQPVTAEAQQAMAQFITQRLDAEAPAAPDGGAVRIAGLGGTASTIVWMLAGQRGQGQLEVNQAHVRLDDLEALLTAVAPLDLNQLKAWPNLNPERAPIIYAGISIIAALLKRYGASEFTVVDRGLRYGLLLDEG